MKTGRTPSTSWGSTLAVGVGDPALPAQSFCLSLREQHAGHCLVVCPRTELLIPGDALGVGAPCGFARLLARVGQGGCSVRPGTNSCFPWFPF